MIYLRYRAAFTLTAFAFFLCLQPFTAAFAQQAPRVKVKGHSYHAVNFADMIRQMAEQVKKNTPAGDSRAWTEY